MKIALLFGIFPEEFYTEILSNSKGGIQYAADALQKSFMEGIGSLAEDVEIVNIPYIGSYPNVMHICMRLKVIFNIKRETAM